MVLIFLGLMMPSIFNKDPLGTGQLLGLVDSPGGLHLQYEPQRQDTVEFVLEPFQSLEYRYLMDPEATMVFSWRASSDVFFDLSVQDLTREDHIESYLQGTAREQQGGYVAAFTGQHGWFWENRGFDTITLKLVTSGFYIHATETRLGSSTRRELAPTLD